MTHTTHTQQKQQKDPRVKKKHTQHPWRRATNSEVALFLSLSLRNPTPTANNHRSSASSIQAYIQDDYTRSFWVVVLCPSLPDGRQQLYPNDLPDQPKDENGVPVDDVLQEKNQQSTTKRANQAPTTQKNKQKNAASTLLRRPPDVFHPRSR